jgi:Spy/CpxP family protein refolding chaperone
MWKEMKTVIVILVFSVALNTAFGAMWAIHRLPAHLGCIGRKGDSHAKSCVSCPLHRKLGTSEKQWQEIEPRLVEFKTSSQAVCRKTNQLREELIDLIAAPQTDFEAIRAKQDEILAGQRRMQELLISHLLAEKEMLTPQQQESLFDMIRKQGACAGSSSIMSVRSNDIPQADLNHAGNNNHNERR